MKIEVYFMDGRVRRLERETRSARAMLDTVTEGRGSWRDCGRTGSGTRVFRQVDPGTGEAFGTESAAYSFRNVGSCLARFFALEQTVRTAGNMSMDPDHTLRPTKTSGDSMVLIECLDLSLLLRGVLDNATVEVLRVEFADSDLPISGAPHGRNKLAVLRVILGDAAPRTSDDYVSRVREAIEAVAVELESRGWIPERKRRSGGNGPHPSAPTSPPGSFYAARKKFAPTPACPGPRSSASEPTTASLNSPSRGSGTTAGK